MRTVLAILLNAGAGSLLGAQSRSNLYLDVTVGSNVLLGTAPFGGEYYEQRSLFALLAVGDQPDADRPLLGAIHVGLLTVAGGDDACDRTPLGGCYRDFPLGAIAAITIGARPLTSLWRVLELTAGPALIGRFDTSGSAVGLLAVGRVGAPPGHYLSPGLAFHGIVTPIDGTLMFAAGFGVSLRTW